MAGTPRPACLFRHAMPRGNSGAPLRRSRIHPKKKFIAAMAERLRADLEYPPVGRRGFRLGRWRRPVSSVTNLKFTRQNAEHSHDPLRCRLVQLSQT